MSITHVTTLVNQNQTVTYTNAQGQNVSTARSMEVRVIVPDKQGNYPIVFYSHGHTAVPAGTGSANAKALADLGYIVILPTHLDSLATPAAIRDAYPLENPASTLHRVADIKYAFDSLLTLMEFAPGYTADTTTPVIAGHSHGSWTTYLLTGVVPQDPAYTALPPGNPYGLASLVDTRFKASIVLSPPSTSAVSDVGPGFNHASWNGYVMPSLSLTGTLDVTGYEPTYASRLAGFELSPAEGKHAIVLRDSDHVQIGGFSASTAQTAALAQAMDAFLDAYVKGEPNRLSDPATVLNANNLYSEALIRKGAEGARKLRCNCTDEPATNQAAMGHIKDPGSDGIDTARYASVSAGFQAVASTTGEIDGDLLTTIEVAESWWLADDSTVNLPASWFICDAVTNQIFYDKDGMGGGAKALLCTLQADAATNANDFILI